MVNLNSVTQRYLNFALRKEMINLKTLIKLLKVCHTYSIDTPSKISKLFDDFYFAVLFSDSPGPAKRQYKCEKKNE